MYFIFNKSPKYSGNSRTLERLAELLKIEKTEYLLNELIAINAYNFGKIKNDKKLNFIIIIGGTDINFTIKKNPEKYESVKKVFIDAKYVVVFSKYMCKIIEKYYKISPDKIKIIPQSVPKKLKSSKYDLREVFPQIEGRKIYISVGNLRPVKRPKYLFNFFKKSTDSCLIHIGKILEGQYIFPKNVYHINGLSKKKVYSCMKQAVGLINTSISEGMALSILESMKLKCPVYAFKNLGNLSIIKHGFNGFIFYDIRSLKFLLTLPTKKIINTAYDYVYIKHSCRMERHEYLELID